MRFYGCGYNDEKDVPSIWLFDTASMTETNEPPGDGRRADGLRLVGEYGGVPNPSYGELVTLPLGKRVMLVACELGAHAQVASFEIGEDGNAVYLDSCQFADGAGTCFVLASEDGSCVYGADYNSGSICSCQLEESGRFGEKLPTLQHRGCGPRREQGDPNHGRQMHAHVHTLSFVPGTGLLTAVDLGMDRIRMYEPKPDGSIDAGCLVGQVEIPEGCGPRIVAYHPTLLLAAVVCELSCEVLLYSIEDDGKSWELAERHGLIDGHAAEWTAPDARDGVPDEEYPPLSAHAEFSADGRFLYVSTRGTNTITVFAIDEDGHARQPDVVSCGGHSPRHFAISPDQSMLAVANQVSNDITLFERDSETGMLKLRGKVECHQPSCVIWE